MLAALLGLVALAGCGGSSPTEAEVRKRLEAAAAKTAGAPLIVIGDRAWYVRRPGGWTTVAVRTDLAGDQFDPASELGRLLPSASDLHGGSDAYEFSVPLSALARGGRSRPGRGSLHAAIDDDGYLTALATLTADWGPGDTVPIHLDFVASFEDFGRPQRIEPPPAAEVSGHAAAIEGLPELEALLGGPRSFQVIH
jgi:hypothetical protein